MSHVTGLSVILQTNEEVDQAAGILRSVGLQVTGEDGYVEVDLPAIKFSIMRGAMVEVPRHGGLLVQVAVDDVVAAAAAAEKAGASVAQGPITNDGGGVTAYVQAPAGFTIELNTTASREQ